MYIGRSLNHARNVAMVLDTETGLVSPQYHVKFDTRFETVPQVRVLPQWQRLSRLCTKAQVINKTERKDAAEMQPRKISSKTEGSQQPNTTAQGEAAKTTVESPEKRLVDPQQIGKEKSPKRDRTAMKAPEGAGLRRSTRASVPVDRLT